MPAAVSRDRNDLVIRRGPLSVEIGLQPFALTVRRAGRRVVRDVALVIRDGVVHDQFIQFTEGVVAHEDLEDPVLAARGTVTEQLADGFELDLRMTDGSHAALHVSLPAPDRVALRFSPHRETLRVGVSWAGHPEEHLTGLGARHGLTFDQRGRDVQLGADRRYTGPDCPPDMLEIGGIPQGDYLPVPFLLSSRRWAAHLDTFGNGTRFDLHGERVRMSVRQGSGPLDMNLFTQPTPLSRLRAYLRHCGGFPALLPEWGYGHWKSRDVYEHQRDVEEDFEGYGTHGVALDAIVIDSPWASHYNDWTFNPHQFPDAPGLVRRMRGAGVRTVLWVTPWTNLESVDGQRVGGDGSESERMAAEPAPNYDEAAAAGHFVLDADGTSPYVARWWMGTGSPVDLTKPAADRWWRDQARPVLELGVEGIKADDGEGYYFPDDVRIGVSGDRAAAAAWRLTGAYARSMQGVLDEVHGPGVGMLFARSGWAGSQATGVIWGGDQASDFWSLRCLVAATLTAAASGFSNWSHDVGGYLGEKLVDRCPKELLLRWVQFGCFTPLMQAHGRFAQEAWTYDDETLRVYREHVLLHERLVPYVRAAAATAARCGLPIIRPLCLTDPADRRGWEIADAYGYGPALWVAPVLEAGAREREVDLPRGEWIDLHTGEHVRGGGEVVAAAPLERVPVWVRNGSIVVTYPADHVAAGLGDTPEHERPLEATLWGAPSCGHASVRLADGTRIAWSRRSGWSLPARRHVTTAHR